MDRFTSGTSLSLVYVVGSKRARGLPEGKRLSLPMDIFTIKEFANALLAFKVGILESRVTDEVRGREWVTGYLTLRRKREGANTLLSRRFSANLWCLSGLNQLTQQVIFAESMAFARLGI